MRSNRGEGDFVDQHGLHYKAIGSNAGGALFGAEGLKDRLLQKITSESAGKIILDMTYMGAEKTQLITGFVSGLPMPLRGRIYIVGRGQQ